MSDIFISTIPFGTTSDEPLKLIMDSSLTYQINPLGRKITEEELSGYMSDVRGLVAGTEPITRKVMDNAPKLEVISRLGVGTDNIDLEYAHDRNIKIQTSDKGLYDSVAEFTLGLILNLFRNISSSNQDMRNGKWEKKIGIDIKGSVIGIIGAGKIGKKVINLLLPFSPKKILVYDPHLDAPIPGTSFVDLEDLLRMADLITIHAPLMDSTREMISKKEFRLMQTNSILVNTSRGDLVNQEDLYYALSEKKIAAAALDVFSSEPYQGQLTSLDNCFATPHIAPMTRQSRESMELEAVKNCLNLISPSR